MNKWMAAAWIGLAAMGAPAWAEEPGASTQAATQPMTQPAVEATPEAIAMLDRIEARGPEIKSIQADVRYDRIVAVAGDKQRRFGKLLYLPEPPAKFSVWFDRLLVDGRLEKQGRWYIFDGLWLVERLDDKKQFFKRQIVPPKVRLDSPEEADPLGSGRGPFLVPLSLKKARVLARFAVSIAPNKPKDPADTTQLLLKPRADQRSEYTEIHIWVSNASLVPVRVSTMNDSGNESVIDLTDVKINDPSAPASVDTAEPAGDGWQVSITPWKE